jgi:esterase/lipase
LEENLGAKEKKRSFISLRLPQVKKPKKFTDMCGFCIERRRAQNHLTHLLETGNYENKDDDELKKRIQNFEKDYAVPQKKTEKFKEEIKTLHCENGVLVIEFSSNLKLNLKLIQKNKNYYNQLQRTLFVATLVYVDENENRKFFYFHIIPEILDYNFCFVN